MEDRTLRWWSITSSGPDRKQVEETGAAAAAAASLSGAPRDGEGTG